MKLIAKVSISVKKGLVAAVLVWVSPSISYSEDLDSYLCKVEMSTGFKLVAGTSKWQSTNFIPDGTYLLRPTDTEVLLSDGTKTAAYEVVAMGAKYPEFTCATGFSYWYESEGTPSDWLFCSGAGEFKFNRMTLRFVSTYTVGWTDSSMYEEQKDGNTPSISLGSCAAM